MSDPSGILGYYVTTLQDDELPSSIAASDKPTIRCGCRLWKLTKIDHVDGSFFCRMGLLLEWIDPENVGKAKGETVGPRWDSGNTALMSTKTFCPLPRLENVKEFVADSDQRFVADTCRVVVHG